MRQMARTMWMLAMSTGCSPEPNIAPDNKAGPTTSDAAMRDDAGALADVVVPVAKVLALYPNDAASVPNPADKFFGRALRARGRVTFRYPETGSATSLYLADGTVSKLSLRCEPLNADDHAGLRQGDEVVVTGTFEVIANRYTVPPGVPIAKSREVRLTLKDCVVTAAP